MPQAALAIRPQPLGIFPLPAGYLLLPPGDGIAEFQTTLLQGIIPDNAPPSARFYLAALAGYTTTALTLLANDQSDEAHYNRIVLQGDPESYPTLRAQLEGEYALLLDMVAYTLGWIDAPPDATETDGEIRATLLSTQAAYAIENGNLNRAHTVLNEAVAAARPTSPLLSALLLGDLAEVYLQGEQAALAIQAYRESLTLLEETPLHENRAQTALKLGLLYHDLSNGQRETLHEAVRCYQEALRFYTKETIPEAYAMIQNNLALAYLAVPLTEASDQLRMAIAIQALREALTIYTRETHPDEWSSAQLNLANALQYLPSSHPADNLSEAVTLYEELLQSRDVERDPLGYARLLANQGNALAHLGIFNHARPKLQEAARLFASAGDHESAATLRGLIGELTQQMDAKQEQVS